MSKRIEWVDSAKGIGIILVILGHSCIPEEIKTIIYSFHMPLFFLLSGLFLYNKQRSFREEIVKKIRSLIIPYIVFNLVSIIFFTPIYKFNITDILDKFIGIFIGYRNDIPYSSYLWFLPCMFFASCMLYPLAKIKSKINLATPFLFMTIGILLNVYVHSPLPMSIDNAFFAASFLAIGIQVRSHLKFLKLAHFWFILPVFIISTYCNISVIGGRNDMYICEFGNYLYFYIAAISGIGLTIIISKRNSTSTILNWAGRNSLIIYCVHSMVLTVINFILVRIPYLNEDHFLSNSIRGVFATILVLAVSMPIVKILNDHFAWSIGKQKIK